MCYSSKYVKHNNIYIYAGTYLMQALLLGPLLADNLRIAGLYYPLGIAKKAPPHYSWACPQKTFKWTLKSLQEPSDASSSAGQKHWEIPSQQLVYGRLDYKKRTKEKNLTTIGASSPN
jgi:hypothetical protein